MDKRKMRRKNLLYKLRRKGVRCSTKERMIFYPYGGTRCPWSRYAGFARSMASMCNLK